MRVKFIYLRLETTKRKMGKLKGNKQIFPRAENLNLTFNRIFSEAASEILL